MAEIDLAGLDACVEQQLARWTVPGAVVGIWRNGQTELRAYGIANLDVGWPVRSDMRFRIASISKVFTATLAMTLVDEGRLDLDTPIVQYLPDLELADAEARATITMRHLLSHTSGLYGDYSADFGLGDDALMRAMTIFATLPQQTRPGEIWAYCNSGFQLAGTVIARILGTTFDAAMEERVFGPAGLTGTCFAAHETFGWPCAIGHVQTAPESDEHVVTGQYYPRNHRPAGGIISTAADLLRFARLHMNEGEIDGQRVLSAAAAREMQTAQTRGGGWDNSWGVGWDLQPVSDTLTVGHGGSISGFESLLRLVPEQQVAFVVLTNSGRGSVAYPGIEKWLLEHVCGLRPEAPQTTALPEPALAALAGQYGRPGYQVTVSVAGGGLHLDYRAPHPLTGESVPYPSQELAPVSETEFLVLNGQRENERVEFVPGANGHPRFVRMHGRLAGRIE
jgi:CubicO group peptidase (beta-lactamase class C family)